MSSPKISVIVPVYKVEQYLSKCIQSILAQTFTDFELLLINDGSPDKSGEICEEYAMKDGRIRVFHKENGGVSSARNLGLDKAKGGWIMFVDGDDLIHHQSLEFSYDEACRSKVDLIFFGCIHAKSQSEVVMNSYASLHHKNIFNQTEIISEILKGTYTSLCARLYKYDLFENYRFTNTKHYEDYVGLYFILKKIDKAAIIDFDGYYYIYRDGSATNKKINISNFDEFYNTRLVYQDVSITNKSLRKYAQIRVVESSIKLMIKFKSIKDNEIVKHYKIIEGFVRKNMLNILVNNMIEYKLKLILLSFLVCPKLTIVLLKK